MTEQGLKYLSDILGGIKLIEEFTSSIKDYNNFLEDIKTQSAVERQLSIIGEAINKYNFLKLEEKIDNSRKIVGLRNRLIHAYDSVDSYYLGYYQKSFTNTQKRNFAVLINASSQQVYLCKQG